MTKKTTYFKHIICLISIFSLGNLLIVFPVSLGANQTLLSIVFSVVIAFFLSTLLTRFLRYNVFTLKVSNNNSLNVIFKLFFLIFALFSLFITVNSYVLFVDEIRLPNTSALVISAIYVMLTLYLATRKKKVIYVLSLFAFFITALSLIVIFVLSAPNIDFALLKENLTFNVKSLTIQTLFLLAYGIGQIIIAAMFIGKLPQHPKQQKVYILGLMFGIALLLITVLNIILVLGTDLISKVQYPYSTMTGIITLGNSFSRMDGITYLIYFITTLIKSAVILKVIITVANKIGVKTGKIIRYITVILTIFIGASEIFNKLIQSDFTAILLLIFEATIFISLYITTIKKVRR